MSLQVKLVKHCQELLQYLPKNASMEIVKSGPIGFPGPFWPVPSSLQSPMFPTWRGACVNMRPIVETKVLYRGSPRVHKLRNPQSSLLIAREALFMVTVFQGSNILSNSLSAVIVLEEMDGEPWWKLTGYFSCIGGMILGLLVLTYGEEPSIKGASQAHLEPLSPIPMTPPAAPPSPEREDTSLVSSESEPPAFMDFVHAVAKDPFEHLAPNALLCRQISEDGSMHGTPAAFDRPRALAFGQELPDTASQDSQSTSTNSQGEDRIYWIV